jgi:hypothetical protein
VADGAVVWLIKMCVTRRAPRFSIGVETIVPYDSSNRAHVGRRTFYEPDGLLHVGGHWSQIAPRVSQWLHAAVENGFLHSD